jgi:hypothetical protein
VRLRLYYGVRGHHVHGRLFVAATGQTFAKAGELVFRLDEWEQVRTRLSAVEFVEEEPMPVSGDSER